MDHHLRALILHSFIQKINCTIIFFHPDCTVGPGISPDHAFRLAGSTAGRESHPALKISFVYFNTLSVICKAEFIFYNFAKRTHPFVPAPVSLPVLSVPLIRTSPIQSLHADNSNPNRSFLSIFQFRQTTPRNHPSVSMFYLSFLPGTASHPNIANA